VASWTKRPGTRTGVLFAYRQTDAAYPPLWYGARGGTLLQQSGRWHQEGAEVAQYLSLSSHGAWAELIRYEGVRDDNRRRQHHRRLCQLQVSGHRIADLSSFDRYVECGLAPETSIGDHRQSWPLADDLRDAGFDGVLSPSAAYDIEDAVNLTLFGERIETLVYGAMPAPAEVVRPRCWLPTIEITDAGVPTSQALEHACYRPEDHQTFGAWCARTGHPNPFS
jgi:hypothetical protein